MPNNSNSKSMLGRQATQNLPLETVYKQWVSQQCRDNSARRTWKGEKGLRETVGFESTLNAFLFMPMYNMYALYNM